jgi:hypothetical protein
MPTSIHPRTPRSATTHFLGVILHYSDSRRDDGPAAIVRISHAEALVLCKHASAAKTDDHEDERLARMLDRLAKNHAPADYLHEETGGWDDGRTDDVGWIIIDCYGRFDRFDPPDV